MPNKQVLNRIEELVLNLDEEGVKEATQDALRQGFSPQDIISEGLWEGMRQVGDKFEKGEYFLPELVVSAEAMKSALRTLYPQMRKIGIKPAGRIVLATPEGDIHDIGKNIVGALLEGNGFEVHDLGVDVPPERILERAKEVEADVIGMSALVSSGVSKMVETILLLKERNIPAKVIIGGAASTPEAAKTTGADGYGKDAWEGIQIIDQWVKGGN